MKKLEAYYRYFEKLVATPSPSGFEQQAQNVFMEYGKKLATDVGLDKFGNAVIHLPKPGKPKLMLSAHIDEIGFIVKYIDDKGFVSFLPIGGVDAMLLPAARLAVHHGKDSFLGVVVRHPVHLMNDMERTKLLVEDLWLDCGFTSKEHALKSIDIGDPITFSTDPTWMSETLLCSRSCDNKIGNMILVEVAHKLKGCDLPYDTYFVSTTQEEIGLRGGITAALAIEPDMAVIIDATHATDYPTANLKTHGEIRLGAGPSISISPDSSTKLREQIISVAAKIGQPLQKEAHPNASGTEARAIQLQRGGINSTVVSFPVRYMHSPSEIIHKHDVSAIIELLTNVCLHKK